MNHLTVTHHCGRDIPFLVKSELSFSPVSQLQLWCRSGTEVEWKVLEFLYSGYVYILYTDIDFINDLLVKIQDRYFVCPLVNYCLYSTFITCLTKLTSPVW